MSEDAWQDTARRFADPAFAPDWMPPDRPPWPYAANLIFRAWVVARLEELAPVDGSPGRLKATPADALEPQAPAVAKALHVAMSQIDFSRVGQRYALKTMQMTEAGRRPGLNAVERAMSNDAEALASGKKRRGPARHVAPDDERRAVIRAAWDIWLIRAVILPRFWPERHGKQVHLPGGEAEYKRIIAQRYAAVVKKPTVMPDQRPSEASRCSSPGIPTAA